MENSYLNIFKSFIPARNRKDENTFYQSLLLVSALIFTPVFLAIFILAEVLLKYQVETLTLLFLEIFFLVVLFIYPRSGNNILIGNLIISAAYLSFLFLALAGNYIKSPIVPWFTAIAIISFLFTNKKWGYFWSILTFFTFLALYLLSKYQINLPLPEANHNSPVIFLLSYAGASIYTILTILSYEFLNERKTTKILELRKLDQQNNKLLLEQKEKLERAEHELHQILEILPDPAFIINKEGKVTFWNRAIEDLTGVKARDIIGKGDYQYAIPFYGQARPILINLVELDDDFLKQHYSSVKKTGDVLQAETYVPSLRGQERYLIGRATAIRNSKGEYVGAIEVIHDITERHRYQERIESQQQQLKLLSLVASATDNYIAIMEPDSRIIWSNDRFARFFNLKNELINQEKIFLGTIIEYKDLKQIWYDLLTTKESQKFEIKKQIENTTYHTQITINPVLDKNGNIEKVILVGTDITQLKYTIEELAQTQEELLQQQEEISAQRDMLLEQEQKIRTILEILPDAAFMIDKNGVVTFWNRAIEQMTGYKAEDMIGQGDYRYAIPFYGEPRPILIDLVKIDKDYLKAHYKNVHYEHGILKAESYVPSLRGKERYLIGQATAIYNQNGEYIGAVEVIHDVTDLKHAMEKIKSQNKQLELLSLVASNTTNAISLIKPDGTIFWVNDSFTKRYEVSIDQNQLNILEYSNYRKIKEIWATLLSKKVPLTYENKNISNITKEVFYTQTTLNPILDENNNLKFVIAVDTDITELKQTQEKLLEHQEELETQRNRLYESEQKIRKILETLPDPAFMIDENSRVIFWNRAIEQLTGVSAQEIIGKGNYEYAIPFYGERRPILIDFTKLDKEYLKKHYSNIKHLGNIIEAESYVPSLRGEERYLIGRATAIYNSDGQYIGAVEVIHDFTVKKKAQDTVIAQKKSIEDSIHYASYIQRAFFPSEKLLGKYFKDYFIFFRPKSIVSGDFYWMTEIDDTLFIAAADCTGHGVPGAFMTILGLSFLNQIVIMQKNTDPEKILQELKARIINALKQNEDSFLKDGMDIALCKIDKKNKLITFAGAHNPLYVINNQQLEVYKADRMPVGFYLRKEATFTSKQLPIKPGDKYYIFSDGFQDQLNQDNVKITTGRFKQLLIQYSKYTFPRQKTMLRNFLEEWMNGKNQTDDILIIGFQIE